jgi:hypothetical protein
MSPVVSAYWASMITLFRTHGVMQAEPVALRHHLVGDTQVAKNRLFMRGFCGL